jgi:hypothetical protein
MELLHGFLVALVGHLLAHPAHWILGRVPLFANRLQPLRLRIEEWYRKHNLKIPGQVAIPPPPNEPAAPWIRALQDLQHGDASRILRALHVLANEVHNENDDHACDILKEVDQRGLSSSRDPKILAQVFELRSASASERNLSESKTIRYLIDGLEGFLHSDQEPAREAAIVELFNFVTLISEGTSCPELSAQVDKLLEKVMKEWHNIPKTAWPDIITRMPQLQNKGPLLNLVFPFIVEAVLADTTHLGALFIRALSEMGPAVGGLPQVDLQRFMKDPHLRNMHEAEFNRLLRKTVFSKIDRAHSNGRVWKRIPVEGNVHCNTLQNDIQCQNCQVIEVSYRGFFMTGCLIQLLKPFGDANFTIKPIGGTDSQKVNISVSLCRVSATHEDAQNQGRGAFIEDIAPDQAQVLYDFISTNGNNH